MATPPLIPVPDGVTAETDHDGPEPAALLARLCAAARCRWERARRRMVGVSILGRRRLMDGRGEKKGDGEHGVDFFSKRERLRGSGKMVNDGCLCWREEEEEEAETTGFGTETSCRDPNISAKAIPSSSSSSSSSQPPHLLPRPRVRSRSSSTSTPATGSKSFPTCFRIVGQPDLQAA